VLAAADTADGIPFAGGGFVGFDIGATKRAKVIEHQVNGTQLPTLGARQFSPCENASVSEFCTDLKAANRDDRHSQPFSNE